MRLVSAVVPLLCLYLGGCASQEIDPIPYASRPNLGVNAPSSDVGLSWSQVADVMNSDGFDTDGASPYGNGCWVAGGSQGTTLFIDRTGQVFEEFPPESCSARA